MQWIICDPTGQYSVLTDEAVLKWSCAAFLLFHAAGLQETVRYCAFVITLPARSISFRAQSSCKCIVGALWVPHVVERCTRTSPPSAVECSRVYLIVCWLLAVVSQVELSWRKSWSKWACTEPAEEDPWTTPGRDGALVIAPGILHTREAKDSWPPASGTSPHPYASTSAVSFGFLILYHLSNFLFECQSYININLLYYIVI